MALEGTRLVCHIHWCVHTLRLPVWCTFHDRLTASELCFVNPR